VARRKSPPSAEIIHEAREVELLREANPELGTDDLPGHVALLAAGNVFGKIA
jgi:hypothetical protein